MWRVKYVNKAKDEVVGEWNGTMYLNFHTNLRWLIFVLHHSYIKSIYINIKDFLLSINKTFFVKDVVFG